MLIIKYLHNHYFKFLIEMAEKWPENKEELYKELDRASKEEEEAVFQEAITGFIEYINQRTENPFKVKRFRSIHLFFDAYWNTSTDEFKELNTKLTSLLKVEDTITDTKQMAWNLLTGSASLACSIVSYAIENPINTCFLLFMLTVPLASQAAQSLSIANLLKETGSKIRDVTDDIEYCMPKVDATNPGKICLINDKTFFMKELPDFYQTTENHPINTLANKAFVRNIQIVMPNFEIHKISSKNKFKLYLSSERVPHFVRACDMSGEKRAALFRKNKNLAYFAVINSFIFDLHEENYGFAQGKLVLIDIDYAPIKAADEKKDLVEYYKYALNSLEQEVIPPLSLENIKEMKQIYQYLLTMTSAPKFHSSLDISEDNYKKIIQFHISICDKTLTEKFVGSVNDYLADQIYMEIRRVRSEAPSKVVAIRTSL